MSKDSHFTGQMQEKRCFMQVDGKRLKMCKKYGLLPCTA